MSKGVPAAGKSAAALVYVHVRVTLTPEHSAWITAVPPPVGRSITEIRCWAPLTGWNVRSTVPLTVSVTVIGSLVLVMAVYTISPVSVPRSPSSPLMVQVDAGTTAAAALVV